MSTTNKRSADVDVRRAYEIDGVYSVHTICRKMDGGAREYADELLFEKLEAVRRHMGPGLLVDLCCGTGDHLLALCPSDRRGLGLDFSIPYVETAKRKAKEAGLANVAFAVADAMALPLETTSVGTLYSLSALYQVPDNDALAAEVSRVLAPRGRAILDLGNSESLNAICCRCYPELPRMTAIPIRRMIELFKARRLVVIEHRAFQILPLWADRPRWLRPLLHPRWKNIMKLRLRGTMMDEWISSSPLLWSFAFRHLIVLQKDE